MTIFNSINWILYWEYEDDILEYVEENQGENSNGRD